MIFLVNVQNKFITVKIVRNGNRLTQEYVTANYCLDFIHRPYVCNHNVSRDGSPDDEGRTIPQNVVVANIRTIDKVQIIDRSNTAPSSKTFRDKQEYVFILIIK
jgi:hypothetical protein